MSIILTLSTAILSLSIMFTQTSHPLAMGMTLLVQTVLICGVSSIMSNSSWFSYILLLIFLGAMLVLFIYVASLASNETFSTSLLALSFMAMVIMMSFPMMMSDPLLNNLKLTLESSNFTYLMTYHYTPSHLSMIYNTTTMNLTLFIITYLLLTLIVVVKITTTFFGPLRLS